MSAYAISFSTERTQVKPWAMAFETDKGDAVGALVELLTPKVLESLPEPLQTANTPENCQAWIAARLSESEVLAIQASNSNALIGVIILAEFETSKTEIDIHLGYLLAQKYWGKGLASEVIAALVKHLATTDRSIRLLGGVEKSNPASARVLVKAGFKHHPALSNQETLMFARVI